VTQLPIYTTTDLQAKFGISLGNVSSIRAFQDRLATDLPLFSTYLFTKMGYPQWLVTLTAQVWQHVTSLGLIHLFDQRRFTCGMRHFEDQAYQECSTDPAATLAWTPLDLLLHRAL
jgi:hypothetical protein